MPNQDGFEWVEKTFGLEPSWTKEPDFKIIASIARAHLGCDEEALPHVSFYAQGAFNKLYKVSTVDTTCLMRVSLPVDPRYKTESEVATIEFVRQKTSLPVPRIIAFDSRNENELGFEWILMEMMPGVTLRKRWRKMSWDAKENIVKCLVKNHARLFEHRFYRIGNIFDSEKQASSTSFTLDRMVSLIFFWGDHLTHNVSRGPFTSSHDWLKAHLQLVLTDQQRILDSTCDEDEIEDAEAALDLAKRLFEILPTIFLPNVNAGEPTMLFHDDLSMQNIMVDDDGQLTAVIDWECVSAMPLWRACQVPALLDQRTREEKPDKETYAADSDEEDAKDHDGLDNEGMTDLYWEHVLEYEMTQLRKLFLTEMQKTQPEWIAIMRDNSLKADFEMAVHKCGSGMAFKRIKRWIDALVLGDVRSLSAEFNK
jgi:thiamine kinase-like enzyme